MQGVNVGVVDERSELGACYLGIPQNDLGIRTDILDGCPKAEGMMMLIRSMSPRVLAVDEIGGEKDKEALGQALNCGCAVFATAHGTTLSDIEKRGLSSFFERFVLLKPVGRAGEIEGIYERGGKKLW
jgi:stage III sporulation protein AA